MKKEICASSRRWKRLGIFDILMKMEIKQERSKRDLWSMKMEISMELCYLIRRKQKKDMT